MSKKDLQDYVKNVTTSMVYITPSLAKSIIDKTDFKNRDLKKHHIQSMVHDINNDKWELTHQGISISDKGNLIHGQNRLHAIIKAEKGVWMNISKGFPEESFFQIDKGVSRGLADNFNISNIKNHEKQAAGLRKYFQINDGEYEYPTNNKKAQRHRTDMDIIKFYHENEDLCKSVYKKANTLYKKSKMLPLSESYGFMFYTIHEKFWQSSDVYMFMDQLYLIENPEINATTVLFQRLVENKNSPVKLKKKVKWAFIIKTFNAWADDSDLKILRYLPTQENFPEINFNPNI